KIESRMKVRIVLIPNVHIESPQYKIKKISNENYEYVAKKQSFTLVDTFEESNSSYTGLEKKPTVQPQKAAVRGVLPNQPAPVGNKSLFSSILSKIAGLFKTSAVESKKRPIRSKERSFTTHTNNNLSQTTKRNIAGVAKARPVPITKSNTKIQTVRPSANNTTNKVVKLNVLSNVDESKLTEKSRDNIKHTTQAVKINKVVPPYVEITKTHGIEVIPNPRGGRGYNNKPNPAIDESTTNVVNEGLIQPFINKVMQDNQFSNLKNNQIVPPIVEEALPLVVKLPTKEVRNTILDDIDLGGLKLINTNKELLKQIKETGISEGHVKRHNDISKVANYTQNEVNYELVETKRSL
ncbi:MAG: hypothetical protein K2P99_00070, partial [Burkholderiales bacterium]|nr:hypothetical protein [Burkholderiales bacterium]